MLKRLFGWTTVIAAFILVGFALHANAQMGGPEGDAPRVLAMRNTPHIVRIAKLPQEPEFSGYDEKGEPIQLDLGYAYREISAGWMPFWAREDQGFVMFAGAGETASVAAMTDIDRAAIVKALGNDPTASYSFPILSHLWGWLSVAAMLLLTWFNLWREARRKDRAGIM
jgi:hypothetical protein